MKLFRIRFTGVFGCVICLLSVLAARFWRTLPYCHNSILYQSLLGAGHDVKIEKHYNIGDICAWHRGTLVAPTKHLCAIYAKLTKTQNTV